MSQSTEIPGSSSAPSAHAGPPHAAQPTVQTKTRSAAPRARDPWFDNAKYIAICLVAIGHSWVGARGDYHAVRAIYFFVYSFHMPVFIFISGYFSRNFDFSPARVRKLVTTVAVPYLVFEAGLRVWQWLWDGKDLNPNLLDPTYLLWFLCALFCWRLTVPMWQNLRFPVTIAVAASLMVGMSSFDSNETVHRTVAFLPFFVLGLTVDPKRLEVLRRPLVRALSAVFMLAYAAFCYLFSKGLNMNWVYWKKGYHSMHHSWHVGIPLRFVALIGAAMLVMAFLSVTSRKHTWYTALGAGTMAAYLLHGFVVKYFDYTGLLDNGFLHTRPGVIVVTAGAIFTATVLSTPQVNRALRFVFAPELRWVFRDQKGSGEPAAVGGGTRPAN